MDHFLYKHDVLHAEEVAIPAIAAEIGTPFYCYSTATLSRHYQVFHEALASLNPMVCFAVKANSNPHVLAILAKQGAGADVVSEGEIRLAMAAGVPPERIVYSGVGKQRSEMAYALSQGIFQFNVESEAELRILDEVAGGMGVQAPIALRINPDVDAGTHEKITTGRKDSKFGIDIDDAPRLYDLASELPHIAVQGVSVHIGSQLTSLEPFRNAFLRVRSFVEDMRAAGHSIRIVDLGGGLGIPYDGRGEIPPVPAAYGAMITEAMQGLEAEFVFEPGRLIAGNAGILVSSVIYTKENAGHRFLIVDAAMNDLARTAMYQAHHDIVPVNVSEPAEERLVDVVGPVCESSDIFARQVTLPAMEEGALIALRSAGAYGAVMSSTYNARPLVPEVLVDGAQFKVVRAREDYDAMLGSYAPLA